MMTSTEVGTMRLELTFTQDGELNFVWRDVPFEDVTRAMRIVGQMKVMTPFSSFRENARDRTIRVTAFAIVRDGSTLNEVIDTISLAIEEFMPEGTAAADVAMTANGTTVAWH